MDARDKTLIRSENRRGCATNTSEITVQMDPYIIDFSKGDKQCCHEINATNVKILTSTGEHDHGSSKVKLKNIVDYKWEMKNYPARLIAVHLNERYVAYVINVNKVTRMEGMVRVANTKNGLRALIKGMSGEVLDLQFAHIEKEHILACIDVNSLYVHKIDECDGPLICSLLLKIESPLNNYLPKFDRIMWCPFIHLPGDDDEDSKLLVWSRGSVFQCFNINTIIVEHGMGKILESEITTGFIKYEDETITITWVALSPDGSTLGVGSTDGSIRFYQVYIHDKHPRRLHEWKPHNGKPISSFFFLDNLTKNNTDTYWKFAITGAVNNSEFKLWDCGTWSCLQTIEMVSPKSSHFLAEIDRTSSYLVISNLDARVCYVMQIANNTSSNNISGSSDSGDAISLKDITSDNDNDDTVIDLKKDTSSTSIVSNISNTVTMLKNATLKKSKSFPPVVFIKSVAEFPLSSGILSYSIIDAAVRRYKCASDDYLCDELDDYDEETNSIYCVVIRMYIVQSKSMQECHILYQPKVLDIIEGQSSLSNCSQNSDSTRFKKLSLSSSLTTSSDSNNSLNGSNNQNKNVINNIDIGNNNDDEDDKQQVNKVEKSRFGTSTAGVCSTTVQNLIITSGFSNNPSIGNITVDNIDTSINKTPQSSMVSTNLNTKSFSQLNLMTPDAFTSNSSSLVKNERKTPENVSPDVLNTILMLANATGSVGGGSVKSEKINLIHLSNSSKIVENHGENKMQKQQQHHESQSNFRAIDRNPGCNVIDNMTSGGSSPSREVQEIMSLHDYDKNSFSDDELLDDDNSVQENLEKRGRTGEDNSMTTNVNNSSKSSQNSSTTVSTAINNWPKVPEILTTKHSAELQNAANLISQAVNAPNCTTTSTSSSNINNLNNCHMLIGAQSQPPSMQSLHGCYNHGQNIHTNRNSSELHDIRMKLNELIDLVKIQSIEINSLQNELHEMRQVTAGTVSYKSGSNNSNVNPISNNPNSNNKETIQSNNSDLNAIQQSYKLEIQLTKIMEQYLKRQQIDLKNKLTSFVTEKEITNQQLIQNIAQIINNRVMTKLSDIISKVISVEIQRQVAPMLSNKLNMFQHQLQLDVANKLSGYDEMLKENLAEACKSKNILEAFGKSVLMGVQGSLQAAFIESMSSTLIPAYEKSSQNMFQQLHDAFSVGIKEFIEQYNNYLQQLQPMQDSTEDILRKFSGFHENLESLLMEHRTMIQDALVETRKDIKTLEVSLTQQLQTVIRSEIRKSFDGQPTILRSQASTPAPAYGIKDTIKVLLMQGQINKAFHQALLANDLSLVEFILKSADRYAVFTPNCCLEQKVLLSLIQQISADMTNHNDLKHSYLCEALLAIDHDDPIVREHAPKVIKELFCNCQLFLVSYPKSQQYSNIRILMKAVQTILEKF